MSLMPLRAEEGIGSLGTRITGGCELPCRLRVEPRSSGRTVFLPAETISPAPGFKILAAALRCLSLPCPALPQAILAEASLEKGTSHLHHQWLSNPNTARFPRRWRFVGAEAHLHSHLVFPVRPACFPEEVNSCPDLQSRNFYVFSHVCPPQEAPCLFLPAPSLNI